MPMADDTAAQARLVRILAYGKEKTKKTWWATKAAEAGYNVILIDGDDGAHITHNLTAEAKKKVLIVNVVDTGKRATFALFMAQFCRPGNSFIWDEQDKASITAATKRNPAHSYVEFCPAKLTANDVVIIDSWTALATSTGLQFAQEQSIDLTSADKTDWDGYGFQGRFLDYVINSIHALPCHVIVIGHAVNYQKFKGTGKDRKLVSEQIQPISSSGPHGDKIGKHFTDVLYFNQLSAVKFTIDTGGDAGRMGGSRLVAPRLWNWPDGKDPANELHPKYFFEKVHAHSTGAKCEGAVFQPPGFDPKEIAKTALTKMTKELVTENSKPAAPEPIVAGATPGRISIREKLQQQGK